MLLSVNVSLVPYLSSGSPNTDITTVNFRNEYWWGWGEALVHQVQVYIQNRILGTGVYNLN
jgi:hypothetical protein